MSILPRDMPYHAEAAEVVYVERRHRIGSWGLIEHFPATFIPIRDGSPSVAEPRAVASPARGSGQPYLATCPSCSRRPDEPEARTCDRLGCPIRHFALPRHETGDAA